MSGALINDQSKGLLLLLLGGLAGGVEGGKAVA